MKSLNTFNLWFARIQFTGGSRADYYENLSDIMTDTGGSKNFLKIFADDAQRHGPRRIRGMLSGHWHTRFNECGGRLAETFRGSIPHDDAAILDVAQRAGAGAVEVAFGELARVTRLAHRAFVIMMITALFAGFSLLAVSAMTAIVVQTLIPNLRKSYRVSPDRIGETARALFAFDDWISAHYILVIAAVVIGISLVILSLRYLTGPVRDQLDKWLIWRLYRDINGIRFMLNLATIVKTRGNVSMQLRPALALIREGASPWLRYHVDRMVSKIDAGIIGPETFNTGIFDKETFYSLQDIAESSSLDNALAKTAAKIETKSLARLESRAIWLRILFLLAGIAGAGYLFTWYMSAAYEQIDAMSAAFR